MKRLIPYAITLGGVISDFVTTRVGLTLGLYETNGYYHPILTLVILWTALIILMVTIPKRKVLNGSVLAVSIYSFVGAINNSLLIIGTL